MRKCTDSRSGFTLTELLVTIGILGVLTTLTFTAVGRSVLSGHATVSKNNLRQLTAAYIGVDMEGGEFSSFNQTRQGKWVDMIHTREGYAEEVFSSPASNVRHRLGEGNAREDWRMAGPESTYQQITRI